MIKGLQGPKGNQGLQGLRGKWMFIHEIFNVSQIYFFIKNETLKFALTT